MAEPDVLDIDRGTVAMRPAGDPHELGWPGLKPDSYVLTAGTSIDGGRPLLCDIRVERDVAVTMRDGITIYTDILRPEGVTDLPAIVAWSPYGKQDPGALLDRIPGRAGIAKDAVSGLQKWEGPDPAYWCAHGYAVINPDARGTNASEGDIAFWGQAEARDVEDTVNWLAEQPWCNGNVGLTGNSWLANIQWYAASRRPAALKAIAPWEGETDFYRDFATRGGIPSGDAFTEFTMSKGMRGFNQVEDVAAMIRSTPLWGPWWADKRPPVENIDVPAYVVACWTQFHSHGTFDGYRRMPGEHKWLRVHNTHEWPDYYDPKNVEDLRRFFDRYLKELDNDWESTPRVRFSVLDPGGQDTVDRPAADFPLPGATTRTLYLDGTSRQLVDQLPAEETAVRYSATEDTVNFTYRFTEDTEVVGYPCLNLYLEAEGATDADLFVLVDKLAQDGSPLAHLVLGRPASLTSGQLRVSHRATVAEKSTPSEPFHPHDHEDLLEPGRIVSVPLGLWAMSARFRAGEQLQVTISGKRIIPAELGISTSIPSRNAGTHMLHTGGAYDAHLLLPVAPAADV